MIQTFSGSDWRRIDRLIDMAMAEDMGKAGDVTTRAVLRPGETGAALFVAKKPGCIAGLPVAQRVFGKFDCSLECRFSIRDGDPVVRGAVFGRVKGSVRSILSAERTVLNFLQRLSGIATVTSEFVGRVKGTGAVILDTRKTTPGLRSLEKYAVRLGGGMNHRSGLYDMVLIKNNHVDAAGGIGPAVGRCAAYLEKKRLKLKIEVEARTLEEVREAMECPVQRIMLDNMDNRSMRRAVRLIDGKFETEASGNVNLNTVRGIARTGVQFISVGSLTHSAPALDMSLHFSTETH